MKTKFKRKSPTGKKQKKSSRSVSLIHATHKNNRGPNTIPDKPRQLSNRHGAVKASGKRLQLVLPKDEQHTKGVRKKTRLEQQRLLQSAKRIVHIINPMTPGI